MTPDQIHDFIRRGYPELTAERRNNPDGWAFFYGRAQHGADKHRIMLAVRYVPHGVTWLGLSVSSREVDFDGTADDLTKLIDAELRLYCDLWP